LDLIQPIEHLLRVPTGIHRLIGLIVSAANRSGSVFCSETKRSIAVQVEEVTLALFAACNSVRVFAYIPQIHKAATDVNGASAISRTTWSLFLVAHVSTIGYALVNRSDPWLAVCFAGNALCCLAILAIAYWKRRRHLAPTMRQADVPERSYWDPRNGRSKKHEDELVAAALLQ
jgi:hypothetical protein